MFMRDGRFVVVVVVQPRCVQPVVRPCCPGVEVAITREQKDVVPGRVHCCCCCARCTTTKGEGEGPSVVLSPDHSGSPGSSSPDSRISFPVPLSRSGSYPDRLPGFPRIPRYHFPVPLSRPGSYRIPGIVFPGFPGYHFRFRSSLSRIPPLYPFPGWHDL